MKVGVAILISDKIDFKTKTITKDKEGHYIMIKESFQEENKTIVNTYAPNVGAPQYISMITLNINGLNAPTKRHRLAEWIQKQDPSTCCLQAVSYTHLTLPTSLRV